MGVGSSFAILFNMVVVGRFQVKRLIHQGWPVAPLLLVAWTHVLVTMLKSITSKKEIFELSLPNGEQILAKLFADDSLLFLKAKLDNLRKALQIVQLFAPTSWSKCNIEKSRMISLTESDGFDYAGRTREVVGKGTIFRHLGAPLGYYTTPK